MNIVKEVLLASSILAWPTVTLAENLEVQSELQKNKNLVFETLNVQSHHIWKHTHTTIWEKNKEYFQEVVLPKIKVPITEYNGLKVKDKILEEIKLRFLGLNF